MEEAERNSAMKKKPVARSIALAVAILMATLIPGLAAPDQAFAKTGYLIVKCKCGKKVVKGATFDVWIGKKKAANDVTRYSKRIVKGKVVTIKDIKTKKAYSYLGKKTIRFSGKTVSRKAKKKGLSFHISLKKNPKVTYYPNGGTGKMPAGYLKYNKATSLAKNSFTRGGYTFAGWSRTKTGTVVFKDGAKLKRKSSIKLYAVWKKNQAPKPAEPEEDMGPEPEDAEMPVIDPAVNYKEGDLLFSSEAGAYEQKRMYVRIISPYGYPVIYTTDGSLPTAENGTRADDQFMIDNKDKNPALIDAINADRISGTALSKQGVPTATVIRAAALLPDGTMGPVTTKTFFMGRSIADRAATVSIALDPDDLVGYDRGILVKGALFDQNLSYNNGKIDQGDPWMVIANFTQKGREWERAANIELFDGADSVAYENGCGIRVRGRRSRVATQKGFNIYFRDDYGTKNMKYELIPGNTDGSGGVINKYKSFMLRNGGNEADRMKFADCMLQELLSGMEFATQKARPAELYLNGEYYGAVSIQEKYSGSWVESHYGVDKDDVVIFDGNELDEGIEEDTALYEELCGFAERDLSDPDVWDEFCGKVDVQSMADYYAAQIYIGNADWNETLNCRIWRSRETDGTEYGDARWRWMLFDTDYACGAMGRFREAYMMDDLQSALSRGQCPLLAAALENSEFRQMLAGSLRKAEGMLTDEAVGEACLRSASEWGPLLDANRTRFGVPTSSGLDSAGNTMKIYFNKRPAKIESMIQKLENGGYGY